MSSSHFWYFIFNKNNFNNISSHIFHSPFFLRYVNFMYLKPCAVISLVSDVHFIICLFIFLSLTQFKFLLLLFFIFTNIFSYSIYSSVKYKKFFIWHTLFFILEVPIYSVASIFLLFYVYVLLKSLSIFMNTALKFVSSNYIVSVISVSVSMTDFSPCY